MFPNGFETEITMENRDVAMNEKMPFRMLVLGDWSGRGDRSDDQGAHKFRAIEIDRDSFGEVMRRLGVKITLSFETDMNHSLSMEIKDIDDFHPDQIFQKLPVFANLREIRRKLLDSGTFDEAAREVNSWLVNDETEKSGSVEATENYVESEPSNNLLDQILANNSASDDVLPRQTVQKSELSEFIGRLVKPHIVQVDSTEQSKLLLIVDEVVSDLMRKILHHPAFQALESAWRGLYLLVHRAETNSDLKVYLMDVTKTQLSDELKSQDDLTSTSFYEAVKLGVFVNLSDNEPWTIIGGNYSFYPNVEDTALILRMGKISADLMAPFISSLDLNFVKLFGFKQLDDKVRFENSDEHKLWTTLQRVGEAENLAFVSPRFLVRLPYGNQTDPTDNFAFEELLDFNQRESYLWTNCVFIALLMIAQTFSQFDWEISDNFVSEIKGLPVHFYQEENEITNIACTEVSFNEKNCERLLEQGIMPLISYRSSDKIRLLRFQSVAKTALNGKWN